MSHEYCPHCQADRNTRSSIALREEKEKNGKTHKMITTSYHCETCNSFIRSEEGELS